MIGAKESFSEQSMNETLATLGDAAFNLEKKRLSIYKTVARPDAYEEAEQNFQRVFSKQQRNSEVLPE